MPRTNLINERHQRAVLWAFHEYDDDGEVTVYEGLEIKVAVHPGKVSAIDSKGNLVRTPTLIEVGFSVAVGSLLWIGKQEDLPELPDLLQVIEYREYTDINATRYHRDIQVMKYRKEFPNVTATLPKRTRREGRFA